MNESLKDTLRQTQGMQHKLWLSFQLIEVLRSLLIALVVTGLWSHLRPGYLEPLLMGSLCLLLLCYRWLQKKPEPVTAEAILKSLESQHASPKVSAFQLLKEGQRSGEWQVFLNQHLEEMAEESRQMVKKQAQKILIPLAALSLFLIQFPDSMQLAYQSVQHAVAQFSKGQYVEIVNGAYHADLPDRLTLSTTAQELVLHEKNRIRIVVVAEKGMRPYVELRPKRGDAVQTFSLVEQEVEGEGEDEVLSRYEVLFNVPDDADIFVSSISSTQASLRVDVEKLPVPIVSLRPAGGLLDPWPDEQPLNLLIKVEAENPLRLVRLKIRSEGQEHEELVSNILAEDKKVVNTDYSLLLESYVQKDLSTIEIVAEAIDRGLPQPLLGVSQPLIINTASAYGRYQQTLATLREVKSFLDEAMEQDLRELDPETSKLMSKAMMQAASSPFFDSLDRVNLRRIQEQINLLAQSVDMRRLAVVSDALNQFLFDHETLDDRERDRDFFVAARALSRLVEKKKKDRHMEPEVITRRLQNFVDERKKRWEKRIEYLGGADKAPKQWSKVSQGQFQKALGKIGQDSKTNQGTRQALQDLSELVSDYREWISALEKAEDTSRREQEQKRQKGLADMKEELRKLQKKQSRISSKLDQAAQQDQKKLAEQWNSIRMDQNGNVQQTKKLEAKLRSLSPNAAERIQFALEMMKMTVKSGNSEKFVQAETTSDTAGRALRDASKAASQSQRRQQRRGRRRRVGSDDYYGSSVAGGDIEIRREYEVDRRYREDILDDVSRAQDNSEDRVLLDNYLRKVIR